MAARPTKAADGVAATGGRASAGWLLAAVSSSLLSSLSLSLSSSSLSLAAAGGAPQGAGWPRPRPQPTRPAATAAPSWVARSAVRAARADREPEPEQGVAEPWEETRPRREEAIAAVVAVAMVVVVVLCCKKEAQFAINLYIYIVYIHVFTCLHVYARLHSFTEFFTVLRSLLLFGYCLLSNPPRLNRHRDVDLIEPARYPLYLVSKYNKTLSEGFFPEEP
jgi:hypothetical protein